METSADNLNVSQKNRIWHFMQIVSNGDNLASPGNRIWHFIPIVSLNEMLNTILWEK